MAKTHILAGGGGIAGGDGTVASNSTKYFSAQTGGIEPEATEANIQVTYRTAGTASGLNIHITVNAVTAASTLNFRVGAATVNQTLSIGSSTTGEFNDATHSDSISAGNALSIQLVTGATGGNMTVGSLGFLYDATGTTLQKVGISSNFGATTASTSFFFSISGDTVSGSQGTEANGQFKVKQAYTVKNLYVFIVSNARANACTINTRKNTANGVVTVSITASTSGAFEDTTHSDSLVSGDLVDYVITTGTGTAAWRVGVVATDYQSSSSNFVLVTGNNPAFVVNISTTNYLNHSGTYAIYASETNAQTTAQISFTASNLECQIATNTISAASTLRFRNGAVNGNGTVSITASTTGYFEDAVNTDSVNSTDKINLSLVTGGTGTNMQLSQLGLIGSIASIPDPFVNSNLKELLLMGIGV